MIKCADFVVPKPWNEAFKLSFSYYIATYWINLQ